MIIRFAVDEITLHVPYVKCEGKKYLTELIN